MFEKGNHPKEKHQRETQLTCIPLLLERSCGGREEFTKTQLLIPFHTQKQNEQTDSKGIDCIRRVYSISNFYNTQEEPGIFFYVFVCTCLRRVYKGTP